MAKKVEASKCVLCGACMYYCMFDAITTRDEEDNPLDYVVVIPDRCVECDECVDVCPMNIISHDENTPDRKRFKQLEILEEKCVGCTLCKKACHFHAIDGEVKETHVVDQDKCIQCGVCISTCKKDAFKITY